MIKKKSRRKINNMKKINTLSEQMIKKNIRKKIETFGCNALLQWKRFHVSKPEEVL